MLGVPRTCVSSANLIRYNHASLVVWEALYPTILLPAPLVPVAPVAILSPRATQ